MKIAQFNMIKLIAIVFIIACISDFIILFLLGSYYPGYSQLKNTMSSLGATISPVSKIISTWWILLGIVFVFFGIIFRKAFNKKLRSVKLASLLIILYGLGEGMGSGIFKANKATEEITKSLTMHDILGGIGVIAALIFPLVMNKIITKKEMAYFYSFSWIVFVIGIITMSLFAIRFYPDENNLITMYKGLWQRLFLVNIYTYFITISLIIYNKKNMV